GLDAPAAVPNSWTLASPAPLGATKLQLVPELGLAVGMVLVEPTSGQRYTATAVEGGIVSIEPALGNVAARAGVTVPAASALAKDARLDRLTEFDAFGATERNVQEHALYLGASSALDVQGPTVIELVN